MALPNDPHRPFHPANAVVMVRPASFGFDPEAAATNAFMGRPEASQEQVRARAIEEFDNAAATLRAAGVRVLVLEDTPEPATPDAVFPNNWFSTHEDGTLVLYPMHPPTRRLERRPEDLLALLRDEGFAVRDVVDLSASEGEGRFLEGTGSLVLDRAGRVAYAARSPRTNDDLAREWGVGLGYSVAAFDAWSDPHDAQEHPIYHTNVLLSIAQRFAIVCPDVVCAPEILLDTLAGMLGDPEHEVITITQPQMDRFCANTLELCAASGEHLLVMSRTAHDAYTPEQRQAIERFARPAVLDIPTIESVGGGSARCMLAEVFLPRDAEHRS